MQQIKTVEDIRNLGTILSVWAHPDDESFSCAGIMAAAVANAQDVICVTATRGEAGVQDESRWPAAKLGNIREDEMARALKAIGVNKHHWLGYADGGCDKVPAQDAASQLVKLIQLYKPQTILTFGPDGITGHTDHSTVSSWVTKATDNTDIVVYHAVEEEQRYIEYMIEADKKFNIYFNIDKPPVVAVEDCDVAFELPSNLLAKKMAGLKAMPSQTEAMFTHTPDVTMQAMLSLECFVRPR